MGLKKGVLLRAPPLGEEAFIVWSSPPVSARSLLPLARSPAEGGVQDPLPRGSAWIPWKVQSRSY